MENSLCRGKMPFKDPCSKMIYMHSERKAKREKHMPAVRLILRMLNRKRRVKGETSTAPALWLAAAVMSI